MTAVLVLGFNRPDRLRRVLSRVIQARPDSVYVAIDGPRGGNVADIDLVEECQDIARSLTRDVEANYLFQPVNLGCGRAVSRAVSWFFESEERGIILEDDVLPGDSFFSFANEMLEHYSESQDVLAVSGCNFVPPSNQSEPEASYRFSAFPHVWGWGTWRRAWAHYAFDLPRFGGGLRSRELLRAVDNDPAAFAYWRAIFELVRAGKIDTWDYQFMFACARLGGRVATSNRNLVENIGFDDSATHTRRRPAYLRTVEAVRYPLVHPVMLRDFRADQWTQRNVFGADVRSLGRSLLRSFPR